MSATEQVKERAYELGFDLVRVTSAAAFPETEQIVKDRIAAGLMDGLDWFTAARAEVSCTPRALLPTARSVISLGTFYLTDAPRDLSAPGDPHGRISCYAWGDDYHDVIRAKLDQLTAYIRTLTAPGEEKTIVFVDTGRMVDRAVAQRSGLGWYGKNTLILTKGWGSWVFLAEVVTNLELEPDRPIGANCGRCELCLRACPTGALVAPYVLDNRRCISYLTIELRGSIPLELRPLIGNHIFGCDICQEVCPVNRVAESRLRAAGAIGASPSSALFGTARRVRSAERLGGSAPRYAAPGVGQRLEFQPRAAIGSSPALIPLLSLTEEEFRERFRHSAIKRAKRRGLLRNVCVALGNIGDPAAVPALVQTLAGHDEPLVRGHAAWALGRIGGPEAAVALRDAFERDPDETVRAEARCALEMLDAGAASRAARTTV